MGRRPEKCANCGATLHPFGDACDECGHPVAEPDPPWFKLAGMLIALAVVLLLADWQGVLHIVRGFVKLVGALLGLAG